MSFNKVMVLGNLGQDPEMRYTPAGLPIANFMVATNERYVDRDGKRQERTEWHRIVVAGKLALSCGEYLKKGRQVFVEGRLRTREWESVTTNGHTDRRTEIVAIRVQFLGTPPTEKSDGVAADEAAPSNETELQS
jgi:single-strand DNA-binding protein